MFIIHRQPFRQVNIKIRFSGIGVFPGPYRQRAEKAEQQQHDPFQCEQTVPDPEPFIKFVGYGGIKHVKDNHVEEDPDNCVDDLDGDQFVFVPNHAGGGCMTCCLLAARQVSAFKIWNDDVPFNRSVSPSSLTFAPFKTGKQVSGENGRAADLMTVLNHLT